MLTPIWRRPRRPSNNGATLSVDYERLLTVFLREVNDQIDRLNNLALELEAAPERIELLDEIFRHTHSIKGGAASFGFSTVSTLTHELESFLLKLKSGALEFTTSSMDTLLSSLDALRMIVDYEVKGEGGIDNGEALQEALGLLSELKELSREDRESSAELTPEISEEDLEFLKSFALPSSHFRRLSIDFHGKCRMLETRVYLLCKKIEDLARIVLSQPPREQIEEGNFQGRLELFLLLEKDDEGIDEQLREACNIDQVEKVSIEQVEFREREDDGVEASSDRESKLSSSTLSERLDGVSRSLSFASEKDLRVDVKEVDSLLHLSSELSREAQEMEMQFRRFRSLLSKRGARMFQETLDRHKQYLDNLRDDILKVRMVEMGVLFQRFPRLVRDLARLMEKRVVFEMEGEKTELDKKLVDEIADPLVHLLRNSVDHGIEAPSERISKGKDPVGRVSLRASAVAQTTRIEIMDDGRGIDEEDLRRGFLEKGLISPEQARSLSSSDLLALLFRTGVSTREEATEISGRGIGLDLVKEQVERLNGTVSIASRLDEGTTFTIDLPLSLAMTKALLVALGEEVFALPMTFIKGTFLAEQGRAVSWEGRGLYYYCNGSPLPLFSLASFLSVPGRVAESIEIGGGERMLRVFFGKHEACLLVDDFIGEEDLIVKSISTHYKDVEGVAGASILGDGRVVLIMDLPTILEKLLHATPLAGQAASS